MDDQQRPPLLTKEQKTGLALLGVVSVLILTLWVAQVRYTLYSPFSKQIAQSAEERLQKQRIQIDNLVEQRDTDQDGLTDQEEVGLYGTSAYLPDTDSDGLTDKQEITLGSDPNCPKGTTCESADALPVVSSSTVPFVGVVDNQVNPFDQMAQSTTNTGGIPDQVSAILENPEMIRAMLLETGQFTEADLAQIPDATLLEIARSSMQGAFAGLSTTTSP